MIKVVTVVGTRPEAIKLAPVIKALEQRRDRFESVVCATSQHREMLGQMLKVFDVRPQYDLEVMEVGQTIERVTSKVLERVSEILARERPDLVLVQGDTTTTFAAGLAGFYGKVRVAHVEAGLRTFEKTEPFPEEINRRLTAVLTDYHFAPTPRARENLLREGVEDGRIVVTGNTGIDALFMALARVDGKDGSRWLLGDLASKLDGHRVIVVTAHRRENLGAGLREICKALVQVADRHEDVMLIYPVHLNPAVRSSVNELLNGHPRILLVDPMEYMEFVALLRRCYLIVTDSGGIQEEAPSLGKPVLVMRNVTERAEAVEAGTARVVGTQADGIVREMERLLGSREEYERMCACRNPYGDGRASERIVEFLERALR